MSKVFKITYEFAGEAMTFETAVLWAATAELDRLEACHEVPTHTISINTVHVAEPVRKPLKTVANPFESANHVINLNH